jgi:hypothetical protein
VVNRCQFSDSDFVFFWDVIFRSRKTCYELICVLVLGKSGVLRSFFMVFQQLYHETTRAERALGRVLVDFYQPILISIFNQPSLKEVL